NPWRTLRKIALRLYVGRITVNDCISGLVIDLKGKLLTFAPVSLRLLLDDKNAPVGWFAIPLLQPALDCRRAQNEGSLERQAPEARHFLTHHPEVKGNAFIREHPQRAASGRCLEQAFVGKRILHMLGQPYRRRLSAALIEAEKFTVGGCSVGTAREAEYDGFPRNPQRLLDNRLPSLDRNMFQDVGDHHNVE